MKHYHSIDKVNVFGFGTVVTVINSADSAIGICAVLMSTLFGVLILNRKELK